MSEITIGNFYDKDGTPYDFQVYPLATDFYRKAGVYMFTKRWTDRQGEIWHTVIYIGETHSFKDRPLDSGHPKWTSAVRLGFNRICAYPTDGDRVAIQDALIDKYNPPLNRT